MKRYAGLLCALLLHASSVHATDVNNASQAELEQLKGIGVTLSERLLAERDKRPFTDWNDLIARLPGVGPLQAKRWSAAGLRVGGAPYVPPEK